MRAIALAVVAFATLSLCAANMNAQTTLVSFDGTNGSTPQGELLVSGSYLYGTTSSGGANNLGTVFRIDPASGQLTTLASFNGTNGSTPLTGLTACGAYLYGTTYGGYGTVFRFDPLSGGLTTLKTFGLSDGGSPRGRLLAVDSILYGTTAIGGANNAGNVFRLDPSSGQFTIAASFNVANGSDAYAGLSFTGSNFYGTTMWGGASGGGVVYRINSQSGQMTTLLSFSDPIGAFPRAGLLVLGPYLYGTTATGGVGSWGTVFKIDSATGQVTTAALLTSETGGGSMGELVESNSYLYGTTTTGPGFGATALGTIFRLNPATGELRTMAQFTGPNGSQPHGGGVVIGSFLYGTTSEGGTAGKGTVYKLSLPVPAATTTTVDLPLASAAYGAQVTLNACVQPAPDGGSLTFRDGTSVLSTVPVGNNGCAAMTTSSLMPGTHSITAAYSGSVNYQSSTSSAVLQVVDAAITVTNLNASLSPSHENYPVTFTANVYPVPLGGNVQFKDGSNVLGTVAVVSGVAQFSTAALTEGTHSIVAVYGGTAQFLGSSSSPMQYIVLPRSKTKGDLDGDAMADVVFQHGSSNAVAGWLLNGSTIRATNTIATPASDWKVAVVADLDGDGKSDLVLRNAATRATAVWRMNGLTILAGLALPSTAADWRVATAFDFTSDDKADLILQNPAGAVAQWEMNGATLVAGRVLANQPADLKVITAARFGGSAGVVLQNSTTGSVSRWLVSGSTITSDVVVATPSIDWKVKGAGDFTHDGVAELVVQSDATNAVAVWTLSASGVLDTEHVIATPVAGWKVVGAADYDGDGRHDILMQNVNDNRIAIWQTDGVTLVSGRIVATLSPGWTPIR
jgi:uncharacterized repeat protein (TIGR03803 family)